MFWLSRGRRLVTYHWTLGVGITCLWAPFDPLGCGHSNFGSVSFLPFLLSFSLSLFSPGSRGVKRLARCGTGKVGCPPVGCWLSACGVPPQSGWARWLVVRACGLDCTVNLLFRWLFAPGGLYYS